MEVKHWYQNAIFYEVYVRAFKDSNKDGHGDLPGLIEKLDYLKELGVDCIWVMPIYPSPLKDDGYDISDYYSVLPEYGTISDFIRLVEEAHGRNIRIIADMVMNHVSDQHPWFQSAVQSKTSPYRDYFVWSDTDTRYPDARIIFLDTEKSNWTFEPNTGQYYWHRFYASQPDLNYDNPRVRQEMLAILRHWLDMGIDGFRVDAVPYLFERDGTNGENLPETHAFLKEIRKMIDAEYPGRILLCEANQWPKDVEHYFGEGDECQMAFQFPVMPRIYLSLLNGSPEPIRWALDQTNQLQDGCQWCTFLRNHDELTLEMVTEAERKLMWDHYAPQKRMRSNLGIRRRLAPLLDNDRRKIELANSILFSLPGTPILYYGDEIGMGDNIHLHDRNGVRTPMQWDASPQAGFSEIAHTYAPLIRAEGFTPDLVNVKTQREDPKSLWHQIQKMIRIRKEHPVLANDHIEWIEQENEHIGVYFRESNNERILVIQNFSDKPQELTTSLISMIKEYRLLLASAAVGDHRTDAVDEIGPFGYLWYLKS